jgi:tetratricopeptide (TPR) repeat protein
MASAASFTLSAEAPPEDPGWPRLVQANGKELVIYQPQVDYWTDYKILHFRCAISVKTGKSAAADDLFKKALAINISGASADREYLYYQGLALKETGKNEESQKLFQKMLDDVLNKEGENTFFTQFEGGQTAETRLALKHYLAGLAYEGLGDKIKAKAEFSETLKINPGHIWSKVHMESL